MVALPETDAFSVVLGTKRGKQDDLSVLSLGAQKRLDKLYLSLNEGDVVEAVLALHEHSAHVSKPHLAQLQNKIAAVLGDQAMKCFAVSRSEICSMFGISKIAKPRVILDNEKTLHLWSAADQKLFRQGMLHAQVPRCSHFSGGRSIRNIFSPNGYSLGEDALFNMNIVHAFPVVSSLWSETDFPDYQLCQDCLKRSPKAQPLAVSPASFERKLAVDLAKVSASVLSRFLACPTLEVEKKQIFDEESGRSLSYDVGLSYRELLVSEILEQNQGLSQLKRSLQSVLGGYTYHTLNREIRRQPSRTVEALVSQGELRDILQANLPFEPDGYEPDQPALRLQWQMRGLRKAFIEHICNWGRLTQDSGPISSLVGP